MSGLWSERLLFEPWVYMPVGYCLGGVSLVTVSDEDQDSSASRAVVPGLLLSDLVSRYLKSLVANCYVAVSISRA